MQEKCLDQRNAFGAATGYVCFMANNRHPWHLKAWLKRRGKTQADLANDLDMNKAKVSLLVNEKQRYDQEDITVIAEYLKLAPYELLMHPDEADALRRFKSAASDLAGGGDGSEDSYSDVTFKENRTEAPSAKPRTGTDG